MYEQKVEVNYASQTKSFLDKTFETESLNNPMYQYNLFMDSYNTTENQVEDIKLEKLKDSKMYNSFWTVTSNRLYLILIMMGIAVPFIGIGLYIWVLTGVILYFSRLSVVQKNAHQVLNPFKHMIFAPQLCKISNTNSKFYEIQIQELEGFSFNNDMIANLKGKGDEGKVRFMVYNTRFKDYYSNFARLKSRHVYFLFTATFCLLFQAFIITEAIILLTRK